jgi:hypothetical protein
LPISRDLMNTMSMESLLLKLHSYMKLVQMLIQLERSVTIRCKHTMKSTLPNLFHWLSLMMLLSIYSESQESSTHQVEIACLLVSVVQVNSHSLNCLHSFVSKFSSRSSLLRVTKNQTLRMISKDFILLLVLKESKLLSS